MKYNKKKHGRGYEGFYNFIAEKNNCIKHTNWEIGSYQGDAIACFIRNDGMVGLLDHCYGSCSGCDDYQAADREWNDNNCDELVELANEYEGRVRWLTKDEQLKRCEEIWLEGQAGYHSDKEGFTKVYREQLPAFIKANS
jgi:hypothetical protein